jgi:hypothetical protein
MLLLLWLMSVRREPRFCCGLEHVARYARQLVAVRRQVRIREVLRRRRLRLRKCV